jgi:sarcosine oxidase delta subunit
MMQKWLEEPNRSQPFNNIEAFPGSVTNDRQSGRNVEDEEYTVEGWSVAYYVREDSPGAHGEEKLIYSGCRENLEDML